MSLELFQHNEKAYRAAVALMQQKGKAAVIQPTGTGKSLIAFKLAFDNPESRVCFLAPSEYIFKTQLDNLKKLTKEEVNNISFLTYTKLMTDESIIGRLQPEYIVLDEFHRCGAEKWGMSVQKLLAAYPDAKVLGLSATNIRYLDNKRDMAVELFDGLIASEMTLGEAIAKEILPAPVYVVSLYSYGKEIAELKKRVASLKNEGLKAVSEELLQKLRRALQKADGLDKIFARHMKKNGKFIVFCANKEHMDEILEHSEEWFRGVDSDAHIYRAYFDHPEAEKEFSAFKKDDSAHLKLLFCINMLNEGVHVDDIDGVVLLRPTVSPILYLQQIGRALDAGKTKTPVVFDVVNNFDSLYCIDSLQSEVQEAVFQMYGKGEQYQVFGERFRIIDEVRECRALFEQLRKNLNAAWDIYYKEAFDYYREHGHLRIPRKYVTESGLTLGSWLQTQRRVRSGKISGILTEEQIDRLNAIGMVWEDRSEQHFNKGYAELVHYYNTYGNVDVKARYVTEEGYALGKWVSSLRQKYKRPEENGLSKEQIEKLNALGMIWDNNTYRFECFYQAAANYYQKYGSLKMPSDYITEDGVCLGTWIQNLRQHAKNPQMAGAALTGTQIQRLNAIGMEWNTSYEKIWAEKYALARKYYENHGDLNVPAGYCEDGVKLGKWLCTIRLKRKNPASSGVRLDEERIRELDAIGMVWEKTNIKI